MNAYLAVEKTRANHLAAANFTKGRDEYFPIPLNQISFSEGYINKTASGTLLLIVY